MALRIVSAAAAAALFLSSPALAGAKIIHLHGSIPTLSGPVKLYPLGRGQGHLPPGLDPSQSVTVYFPADRTWTDRNSLRGPDFPTMDRQLRSDIRPGATIPNAANPYRQRIPPGRTAGNGSPWTGVFKGGATVQGGSMWAGRTYR
ncbi:MAG: hypothetical protein AB7G34_08335 [Hyphomicrobiales bacterium]